MDTEMKLFLDELINQLVKLNKNVEYVANQMAEQRMRQDIILRKAGTANGINKIS